MTIRGEQAGSRGHPPGEAQPHEQDIDAPTSQGAVTESAESETVHQADSQAIDALRFLRSTFASMLNTTIGLVALAIGWLLSSSTARTAIGSDRGTRIALLSGLPLFCALHVAGLWRLGVRSRQVARCVMNRPELVSAYAIDRGWAIVSSLIASGLFGVLFLLVSRL